MQQNDRMTEIEMLAEKETEIGIGIGIETETETIDMYRETIETVVSEKEAEPMTEIAETEKRVETETIKTVMIVAVNMTDIRIEVMIQDPHLIVKVITGAIITKMTEQNRLVQDRLAYHVVHQ